MRVDPVEYRNV